MTEQAQPATTTAPVCYRHPDRETWVSCGKCGRPLCAECMRHGPVGIRCEDCLLRPAHALAGAPQRVGLAMAVALGQAVPWVILLILVGLLPLRLGWLPSPNLLAAGIAGGVVGWSIWRVCGRASDRRTAWTAFAIGAAMPVLAGVALGLVALAAAPEVAARAAGMLALRVLAAAGVGGLFAWLLGTQQRG